MGMEYIFKYHNRHSKFDANVLFVLTFQQGNLEFTHLSYSYISQINQKHYFQHYQKITSHKIWPLDFCKNCYYAFVISIILHKLNKLKQKSMSFLSKIGQDAQKDRKLVMLRKKYYHDILQFNQQQQQKKKDDAIQQTRESNIKIFKMNQQILQHLQQQKSKKLEKKIQHQRQLRFQYERQVIEKIETKKYEKQIEKQFIKMQQRQSDKVSERRLQDLLKIYQRVKPQTIHKRIKTEVSEYMNNPENQRKQHKINQAPSGFLPLIQKSSANNPFKIQNQLRKGRSGQSLGVLSKRTLF